MRTFIFALLILVSFHGQAQVCGDLFRQPKISIENVAEIDSAKIRSTVIEFLKNNLDVPSFLKQTADGEIPVIMVNSKTIEKLRPLILKSAGYMFVQQVGYGNDHGLMRVGPNIIDADTPGARGYGEIHETGLAWKHVDTYLPRRGEVSYVMIETGYLLSKEDYDVINYYQKTRRAAIFRIPFTFGGGARKRDWPNMIESSGENCFGFCKGAVVQGNIREISDKIRQLSGKDVQQVMLDPLVKKFLESSKESVLKAADGAGTLNWKMLNSEKNIENLASLFPEKMATLDKQILVNWIIALDATIQYDKFRSKFKVSGDGGYSDMGNGQTSFMLIYDSMTKANEFKSGTYQSKGVFYNWNNGLQRPLN